MTLTNLITKAATPFLMKFKWGRDTLELENAPRLMPEIWKFTLPPEAPSKKPRKRGKKVIEETQIANQNETENSQEISSQNPAEDTDELVSIDQLRFLSLPRKPILGTPTYIPRGVLSQEEKYLSIAEKQEFQESRGRHLMFDHYFVRTPSGVLIPITLEDYEKGISTLSDVVDIPLEVRLGDNRQTLYRQRVMDNFTESKKKLEAKYNKGKLSKEKYEIEKELIDDEMKAFTVKNPIMDFFKNLEAILQSNEEGISREMLLLRRREQSNINYMREIDAKRKQDGNNYPQLYVSLVLERSENLSEEEYKLELQKEEKSKAEITRIIKLNARRAKAKQEALAKNEQIVKLPPYEVPRPYYAMKTKLIAQKISVVLQITPSGQLYLPVILNENKRMKYNPLMRYLKKAHNTEFGVIAPGLQQDVTSREIEKFAPYYDYPFASDVQAMDTYKYKRPFKLAVNATKNWLSEMKQKLNSYYRRDNPNSL